MSAKETTAAIAYLHACLVYDQRTGRFTWKRRPREHFQRREDYTRWNNRRAGKGAGSITTGPRGGYVVIGLTIGGVHRDYLAHRVAWAMMTGAWPSGLLDHYNRKRADNKWPNLRAATQAKNSQNRTKARSDNVTGVLGVVLDRRCRKKPFVAQIRQGKRFKRLGWFATKAEAQKAYLAAKADWHPLSV